MIRALLCKPWCKDNIVLVETNIVTVLFIYHGRKCTTAATGPACFFHLKEGCYKQFICDGKEYNTWKSLSSPMTTFYMNSKFYYTIIWIFAVKLSVLSFLHDFCLIYWRHFAKLISHSSLFLYFWMVCV